MARQAGPIFFTGTIGDLIFYKQGDNYYVRQKGEPTTGTQKRLKDPNCYPILNMRKREFGEASKLASKVYRQLPKALKKQHPIGTLTGKAGRLLRAGKQPNETIALLKQELLPAVQPVVKQQPETPITRMKQPACTALSAWQVSEEGRLAKNVNIVGGTPLVEPLSNKAGCCAPCRFSGFPTSVRDGCG